MAEGIFFQVVFLRLSFHIVLFSYGRMPALRRQSAYLAAKAAIRQTRTDGGLQLRNLFIVLIDKVI